MSRALTVKNIYDKKYETLQTDGIWHDVLGEPESNGIWLIYGKEKNGKTWLAVMLSKYLSNMKNVLYISAEERIGMAFRDTLQRVGMNTATKSIHFIEYENMEELGHRLNKRNAADVVFVDNLTIYNDELKGSVLRHFVNSHPSKLFIFVAHEERNEPYTSSARLARKLAKVIFHVKGLAADVSGRVPGGTLVIDEHKALIYHGNIIHNEKGINQSKQEVLPAPQVEGDLQNSGKKKTDSHTIRHRDKVL